jgi:branched-chain amino acid aminotransferase
MIQKFKSYYIHNHKILTIKDIADIQFPEQNKIIYEVIRIMDGKLLFLEDHIERFMNSLKLSGITSPIEKQEITTLLKLLIEKNQIQNGNLKFLFSSSITGDTQFYAYPIPHNYPTQEEYNNGIKLTLYNAKRINPSIKEEHKTLRKTTQNYIADQNAYEALFIHPKGYITEGSKSNFFLIKKNTLYTAPKNEVLEGISAKQLLILCRENNIPVIEKQITVDLLPSFDAAFITGTSPKILPVKTIDSIVYDPNNKFLRTIMVKFDELIKNYLKFSKI